MNKKLISIFLTVLIFVSFASCTTNDPAEALAIPEYPLSREYMQDLIDGLKEGYVVMDNTYYDNYNDELKGVVLAIAEKDAPEFEYVGVITNTLSGERGLGVTFVSGTVGAMSGKLSHPGESYSVDSSEKVIKFATKLFGGFSDEEAVYKKFKKEFGKKNTEKVTVEDDSYVNYVWMREIDGIDCEIVFKQMSNKDVMYLYSIIFMTDKDVFDEYSQKQ